MCQRRQCQHAPLTDSGGPFASRHLLANDVAFRSENDVGSTHSFISGLNHTAYWPPVYASQPGSPPNHATLGSGGWLVLAGSGLAPAGFQQEVSIEPACKSIFDTSISALTPVASMLAPFGTISFNSVLSIFLSFRFIELNVYADNYLIIIKDLSDGEIRITDKMPHNFMHLGLIECLFPNATIIHCQRHPFDTCLSIYFRKINENHLYARKLEDIARFYKKYMELMENWHRVSSLQILDVIYENMVTDQKSESEKIISHIGLDWSDNVLDYHKSDRIIMTPSYHQASKPIYTSSMQRWKNYRKHIGPLIDILGQPEQF